MPTYEFACNHCHTEFEARVPHIGDRPDGCPSCGSAELEKRLSSFAAHTNGTSAGSDVTPCSMGDACGRFTGRCGGSN
jgi:putative FmdB family regulatory protein